MTPWGARGPTAGLEHVDDGWWWRWGESCAAVLVGWSTAAALAGLGWLALGGTQGVGIAGAAPSLAAGTLMWSGSALALVGPACAVTSRPWPLGRRLAVAAPVGLAWFAVGRFVLPAPEATWPPW